ncbi:MAG: hypothetical protein HYS23_12655 [Geobacter sp.]|nr:hypothetical protein [Geobacter sp.]
MSRPFDDLTPMDAARGVVLSHPSLTCLNSEAAAIVAAAVEAAPGLTDLALSISRQGQATTSGGWATMRQVGTISGQPVYDYRLSEQTLLDALTPTAAAIRATQNDARLENISWFTRWGGREPVVPPVTSYAWTVRNLFVRFGERLDTVSGDPVGNRFQAVISNAAPRFLSVYAEFHDSSGNVVVPADWKSLLPSGVDPGFETDTRKFIGIVPPTIVVEGIQMAGGSVTFSFGAPNAAGAVLTFGSLGSEPWDPLSCPLGAVLSGVIGFAVPAILASSGTGPATDWYNALLAKADIMNEVMATAGFLRNAATSAQALSLLGDQLGPLIYGDRLPRLRNALSTVVSDKKLAAAAPSIGWSVVCLARTIAAGESWFSGDLASSPAGSGVTIDQGMVAPVTLEIRSDPEYGAWPASAAQYTVEAGYAGRQEEKTGAVTGILTPDPEHVTFTGIPADQPVDFRVSVTDRAGNTCASGSATAIAPATFSRKAAAVLKESRPRFDAGTVFTFSLVLAYNPQSGHHWESGPAPVATVKDLDASPTGHNLADLNGLHISPESGLPGYGWQASGQNIPFCGQSEPTEGQINSFQTLGGPAKPEAALQFTGCGFSASAFPIFGPSGYGWNFFLNPAGEALRLCGFTPGKPFDPCSQKSFGRFNSAWLTDAAVHPDGYVVGINASANVMETVKIGSGDPPGPLAGLAGGEGNRPGQFNQPVAIALTPDLNCLVLENLNRRVQAVDLFGNPVPYFGAGKATLELQLEAVPVTYLDLEASTDGYIFVLLYLNQGQDVSDYRLDLYDPNGNYLTGIAGVNAARMAMDKRGSLYTLNYGTLAGPGNRTEPSISIWLPGRHS